MFINKSLRLNNSKTKTAMNTKISVFVICLKRSYICYNIICITVPLIQLYSESVSSKERAYIAANQAIHIEQAKKKSI